MTKWVALRKESVDRNGTDTYEGAKAAGVALRKESVDRNIATWELTANIIVALRKESVDRNA